MNEAFQLEEGASVSGRIVDDTNNPVELATVNVDVNGTSRTVVSGKDGTFILAGLQAGDGSIQVQKNGFAIQLQDLGPLSIGINTDLGDVYLRRESRHREQLLTC